MIIVGSLVYSIGVNTFIVPHKFLSGGVAGIAIILQYILGISSGYFVILINIPIFLMGIKAVDKEFGVFSFIGMTAMSLSLIFTRGMQNFYHMEDPLISSLCGGILMGVGAGIIFKNRASQGGTDIVAVIIKKKYGISIGNIGFIINAVIVAIGMFIGNLETAVYTLIAMYMSSTVVDKAIQGFDKEKVVLIVTGDCDKVKQAILQKLGRGVTYLYGEGAYTGDKKKVIYCILTSRELEQAKKANKEVGGHLEPHVTCMVGYPWETKQQAQKTIEFTRRLFDRGLIDSLQATVVIPYPGTALFAECEKKGWLKTKDWNEYDMTKPVMKTEMADEQVMSLTRGIYASFITPKFIFKKITSIRNFEDVKFLLRAGKKVLGHFLDFKRGNGG
jgi:uncharacterized membrane-anchored protein YitT (DUF2179 family)